MNACPRPRKAFAASVASLSAVGRVIAIRTEPNSFRSNGKRNGRSEEQHGLTMHMEAKQARNEAKVCAEYALWVGQSKLSERCKCKTSDSRRFALVAQTIRSCVYVHANVVILNVQSIHHFAFAMAVTVSVTYSDLQPSICIVDFAV